MRNDTEKKEASEHEKDLGRVRLSQTSPLAEEETTTTVPTTTVTGEFFRRDSPVIHDTFISEKSVSFFLRRGDDDRDYD